MYTYVTLNYTSDTASWTSLDSNISFVARVSENVDDPSKEEAIITSRGEGITYVRGQIGDEYFYIKVIVKNDIKLLINSSLMII